MSVEQKIIQEDYILTRINLIKDLPTIPVMLFKINGMLEDESCSVQELSKIIETDQAMTAKILRLVNSAFYGFRSKISNMSQALMILGFNTVRNAIISIKVIDTFNIKEKLDGFDITDFWKHAISVAVISKYLADRTRKVLPEDAFVAGLLHDIGKVIILQHFRDHFYEVLKILNSDIITFFEAEQKLSPVNHTKIGGQLAQNWQFSQKLIDAIQFHHEVNINATEPRLIAIVYLSNMIVHGKTNDIRISDDFSTRYSDFSKLITQSLDTVSEWLPDAESEVDEACRFFIEGVE